MRGQGPKVAGTQQHRELMAPYVVRAACVPAVDTNASDD